MSIPVTGLRDLNLNDPKLNITNNNSNSIPVKESTKDNLPMADIHTKSFKITPRKEVLMSQLSPLKSSSNPNSSFNIIPFQESAANKSFHGSTIKEVLNSPLSSSPIRLEHQQRQQQQETAPSASEYRKRMKEIVDLKIVNEDLIKELEHLQDEISHKNQIIDIKSMKIDELMHENNRLLSSLKLERESNENDFNSWLDLKTNLELQIHNLKSHASVTDDDLINTSDEKISLSLESTEGEFDTDMFNSLQVYKNEVNKLKKKVNALRKENELEIQSKIMIMDELEMMRERYLEVDEKHEFLKLDYEDLVNELLLVKGSDVENDDDDFEDQYEEEITNDVVADDSMNTPDFATYKEMKSQGSTESNQANDRILKIRKKRIRSKSSNNSNEDNFRIISLRNNSLNKALREVELKSQKQKYSQELIKYEFEIKSLKLQNEKLLSYIGYTLQVNGIEFKNEIGLENLKNFQESTSMNKSNSNSMLSDRVSSYGSSASNKTTTFDNIEYSDALNIKTAQKNLKTVIKSASALPIRPDTLNLFNNTGNRSQLLSQPITQKKMNRSNTNNCSNSRLQNSKSIEFSYFNTNNSAGNINNDNDSFMDMQSNSLDYSTDYNQGEVECLDIGGSDSFEEYGDDELDEEDDNILINLKDQSMPITNSNLNALNDNNKSVNLSGSRLTKNKKVFISTDSLNVSYKMNFINPKNFKNSQSSKIIPRTQLKRVTQSALNLKKKKSIVNNEEPVVANEFFSKSNNYDNILHVEDDDNDILIDDMNLINGDEDEFFDIVENDNGFEIKKDEQTFKKSSNNSNNNNSNIKYFSMYQISEEDESEYDDNYKMQFSSSEEDDDNGDEDETFNISNQEIDMFKIDFLRRLYCPKHSMFQCFCRSMDLVNPLYFKIFSSPIYSLRRKLRRQHERKSPSLNSLKLKSKLLTSQGGNNKNTNSNNADISNKNNNLGKRIHPMRYHKHETGIQNVRMDEEEEEEDDDDEGVQEGEEILEDDQKEKEHGGQDYCCGYNTENKDVLGRLNEVVKEEEEEEVKTDNISYKEEEDEMLFID